MGVQERSTPNCQFYPFLSIKLSIAVQCQKPNVCRDGMILHKIAESERRRFLDFLLSHSLTFSFTGHGQGSRRRPRRLLPNYPTCTLACHGALGRGKKAGNVFLNSASECGSTSPSSFSSEPMFPSAGSPQVRERKCRTHMGARWTIKGERRNSHN